MLCEYMVPLLCCNELTGSILPISIKYVQEGWNFCHNIIITALSMHPNSIGVEGSIELKYKINIFCDYLDLWHHIFIAMFAIMNINKF